VAGVKLADRAPSTTIVAEGQHLSKLTAVGLPRRAKCLWRAVALMYPNNVVPHFES
jgi:hypothetical protein